MVIPILATLVVVAAVYGTFFSSWAKSIRPRSYSPAQEVIKSSRPQPVPAVTTGLNFESAKNRIRRLSITDDFFFASGIIDVKDIKEVKAAFKEFLLIMSQLDPKERSAFVHGNFQVSFLWEEFSKSSTYQSLAEDIYGPEGLKYDEAHIGDANDPEAVVECWSRNRELIETILNSDPYSQTGKLFGPGSFAYRELTKVMRVFRLTHQVENASQTVINPFGKTPTKAW